ATGTSLFNHPQVGRLELNYERLLIPGSGMLALVTYHAQPGSEAEERLRLLASLTIGPDPNAPHTAATSPARTRQPQTTSRLRHQASRAPSVAR
ncbi:MAG: DNA-binding protein, partial [Actinomycetia bacterium]|nr:DNA-binding protein [Actinomycetes bacterium]